MTNSYKTLEWWFHRYPTIFGKLNFNNENVPAYDCLSCALCVETTPHMFGICTHPDIIKTREIADGAAIETFMDAIQDTKEPFTAW